MQRRGGMDLRGGLMAGSAMLLVGSTVVASKLIASGLPPFTATALRFAIALPLFLALMAWQGQRWPRLGLRDMALLTLQAAAGSVGYTVLLIEGMARSGGSDAGVIAGTLPAMSALVGWLALGEWPNRRQWLALSLASAGVMALQFKGGRISFSAGHLLLLAAVFCEALFILLNKALSRPLAPLQLSTLMSGLGLALAAVPALLEQRTAAQSLSAAPAEAWLAVAYYALAPTVLGFLLWYAGAARLRAAQAALLTALMPVSAVGLSVLLLGEALQLRQGLGMLAVLAALLLLAWPPRAPQRLAPQACSSL